MSQLVYEDQSADALHLNLIKGFVNKQLLTVLCTGNIEAPYGRIESGIIGASHYLEFTLPDGEVLFTEVFACTDLDVDNRIFYDHLHNVGLVETKFGNITHHFSAKQYNWETGNEKFHELLTSVQSDTSKFHTGLQFSFPSQQEDELFPPVTLVFVEADPISVNIKITTLHAYPNEDSLVFTTTQISK